MTSEWTGKIPDPSYIPPLPSSSLRQYADTMMQTLDVMKKTHARLEIQGRVLVLVNGNEIYAIGVVDNV